MSCTRKDQDEELLYHVVAVIVRCVTFPECTQAVRQSQRTGPADQSEHISYFGRRGFIKTGTKEVIGDRLGKEVLQLCKYVKNNAFLEQSSMKAYSSTPQKLNQDFVKGHNKTTLKKTIEKFDVN